MNTPLVTGLGTLLKTEYGQHFKNVAMVRSRTEERVIAFGENKFVQAGYFMEAEGADMFSLDMVGGSRSGLKDMKSIFLSESLAKKLFGNHDPINQVVTMDARWDLTVTGVYKDLPKNTTFSDATYFAPLSLYIDGWATLDSWDNYFVNVYVQLYPGGDFEETSKIIKDVMLSHVDAESVETKPEIFLHPMSQWHLNSEFKNGELVTSKRMMSVWYYSAIGIFVLLLACINFMYLSTARSEKRAREIGIRKSIGSLRGQLVQQFFGEAFMVVAISAIVALAAVQLSLPWFNAVSGKKHGIANGKPFVLGHHGGGCFVYCLGGRQLPRPLFVLVQCRKNIERDFQDRRAGAGAEADFGGCPIHGFHHYYHRYHHCLSANPVCQGKACGLYTR